jgi:hypothetical protein
MEADWVCMLKTMLKTWAPIAKDVATTLAIGIGGLWALFRFVLARGHASNLLLSLTYETPRAAPGESLVLITVRLENKGHVKLEAMPRLRLPDGRWRPAYKGETPDDESLQDACGLRIRALVLTNRAPGLVDWDTLADSLGIRTINVLDEFEVSENDTVDFYLEPDEVVEVTVPIVLGPGNYLGKVHFVGRGNRMEYWSKLFWIRVDP